MSPSIKLADFDSPGRAELTRLVLALGVVAFEDERIDLPAFHAIKSTLPLGQVPVMEVGGTTYAQSMAMARYTGKLTGLYPNDALEALKVDVVCESLGEVVSSLVEILWGVMDEAAKAEKIKVFVEVTLPKIYGMIEKQIAGKFVLGGKISLADVYLFDMTTNGLAKYKDFSVSAYPKINAIVEAVKANEIVDDFIAKHHN